MRGVAQAGSALDWGSRGRRFKSCRPDFGKSLGNSDLRSHDETGAFRGNPVKCVLTTEIGLKTRGEGESVDQPELSPTHAPL